MRKRLPTFLVVLALVVVALPAVGMAAGGLFVDDDTSIFEADINWLAGAGVTSGCNPAEGNTKFCPNDNVTRGQMAAFMRRFARFLGAEDGVVTQADFASDADTLDGYDSSQLLGNGAYSVYNNGPIGITNGYSTLLTLPDLPAGSYLIIAKGWFINGGAGGSQFARCNLVAESDWDETIATVANPSDAIPATWTVVHTFTAASNIVELQCDDLTYQVMLNDAKITAIRLDSIVNQAG